MIIEPLLDIRLYCPLLPKHGDGTLVKRYSIILYLLPINRIMM